MQPKVVFDLSVLKSNIEKLKDRTNNITFLFPVKCCKHPKVLSIITENGFGFDISNRNEFKVIKKYLKKQFVSVCGPLSYELLNCRYDNIHIISSSFESYKSGNGIRINFNSNKKFNISRFGVDYRKLDINLRNKISYIHFHNSDHKDMNKCNYILDEIKKIIKYFPNLQMLDIGGHLEDLTFDEGINYLNRVRNIIPKSISLFVELGDFLFKDVGTLYSRVIDVKKEKDIQFVTLNFSKMANQRWTYPVYFFNDTKISLIKTIFFGSSCCETDIYLETFAKKLNVGDEVIFKNVSPYSYEWNTSFNGIDEMKYIFK